MNKEALHSRLGAAVMNARHRAGETPSSGSIERMTIPQLVAALHAADAWQGFANQFGVVQAGDRFFDRNGEVR